MDVVVQIIERQKQEQEATFRGIAAGESFRWVDRLHVLTHISELSNDIRGERLRFVEAMKEATAINVQGKIFSKIHAE